jgi:hypothetical protein
MPEPICAASSLVPALENCTGQPYAPPNHVPRLEITQEQCDALAERIARVLRERQQVAAERRMRALEVQRRNSQRSLARYHAVRAAHFAKLASVSPELRERRGHRMKTIDSAYEAVMSSNAACDALSEQST